jgi:single-strand DNA-binding protein
MYINKAMVFGNLTRDPELRALPSGMNVANFSLATNRTYKDRDGKKQEQTDFHNVVVFGKTAWSVNTYLKKGSSVYVEGRMQTRSWEQDGVRKYRTEVIAETAQFGPRKTGETTDTPDDTESQEPKDNITHSFLVYDQEPTDRRRVQAIHGSEAARGRFASMTSCRAGCTSALRAIAHQLIPAAAAVKTAAANEQHNHNDDDEGVGVHDRSSALRSAFECKDGT